jgi:hypothetical protein
LIGVLVLGLVIGANLIVDDGNELVDDIKWDVLVEDGRGDFSELSAGKLGLAVAFDQVAEVDQLLDSRLDVRDVLDAYLLDYVPDSCLQKSYMFSLRSFE